MDRKTQKDGKDGDHPQNLADLALEIFGPEHGIKLDLTRPVVIDEPLCFCRLGFDPYFNCD